MIIKNTQYIQHKSTFCKLLTTEMISNENDSIEMKQSRMTESGLTDRTDDCLGLQPTTNNLHTQHSVAGRLEFTITHQFLDIFKIQ